MIESMKMFNLSSGIKSLLKLNKLETDAEPLPPRSDREIKLAERQKNISPQAAATSSAVQSLPIPASHTVAQFQPNQISPNLSNNIAATQNVYQFENVNGVQIGNTLNISYASTNNSSNQTTNGVKEKYPRTTTIQAMMLSDATLEREVIDLIATHLGEGWRGVIRHLGFSEGELDQMVEDHHHQGVKEIIYQCLLDWTRNDETANVGKITTLLWRNGHRETVYILKRYWKDLQRRGN